MPNPKKSKLSKDKCQYCNKRILEGKVAFIANKTYCGSCFNKIKKWGPENDKHSESKLRLENMRQMWIKNDRTN